MKQYEMYLNEIFIRNYKEILPIVRKLNNLSSLNKANDYLNELINSLKRKLIFILDKIQNLPLDEIELNLLCNLLYSLNSSNLDFVQSFLDRFHYMEIIEKKFNSIIAKILNYQKISLEELSLCQNMIIRFNNSNLRDVNKINMLINAFCRDLIIRSIQNDDKRIISYELFEQLIKIFVEEQMRYFYFNPECHVVNGQMEEDEDRLNGTTYKNVITLSDYYIKALYFKGSNEILNTIYHELRHVYQDQIVFKKKDVSSFEFLEIEDKILSLYVPGYYDENYNFISFEKDACYFGLTDSMRAIRNLGFTFDDEDALKKLKAIKREFFKKERKIKGKLISIDEEFEDVIKKRPFLLKEFPSLKSYYYIENGLVFKRSNGKKLS